MLDHQGVFLLLSPLDQFEFKVTTPESYQLELELSLHFAMFYRQTIAQYFALSHALYVDPIARQASR